ncbi:MAG: hypothetical protein F6K11_12625 [Leptolyngbya sp. SIO3F4]|nr:hypothetical protein [Leptolyngbya sp. SIO3F4]
MTIGTDNLVKIWSRNGELLRTLDDHKAIVFQALFNPDDQSFATASNDQTVKIWSLRGELLRTLWHPNEIYRMRYSPTGQKLLVAHGHTPTLWNLDSEILKPNTQINIQRLTAQACDWLKPYLDSQRLAEERDIDRDQVLCTTNSSQLKASNLKTLSQ